MLNLAQLQTSLGGIFTFEYSAAGVPVFSQLAGLTSPADAASAWADALVTYCSGATAGGASLSPPGQITAQQPALQAKLAASFALPTLPTLLTDMVNAIGDLYQVPPAVFGGFVITDTAAGRTAAIAALLAMPPTPDNLLAAATFATVLDTMVRTFTATMPGSPPVVVTLL